MLAEPETRLAATPVAKLLEDSAKLSGCEDFAIRLAERRTFRSLGGIAPILERRTSLREVVSTTVKLKRQLNDVFDLQIIDDPCRSFIQVGVLPQFGGRQATDLVAAITHILLRGASRDGWRPLGVHLNHETPKNTARFDRFFGAPVKFGQPTNGFQCERNALDRPWAGNALVAAAELVLVLEARIGRLALSPGSDEAVGELKALLADVAAEIRHIADRRDAALKE